MWGIGHILANVVEAGPVFFGVFRGAGMIGPGGSGPIAGFAMQLGQETRCVAGIFDRVEHLVDRPEIFAVPFEIDLKATNVETAGAAPEFLENIGAGGVFCFKPMAFALHIDGPWPGLQLPATSAPGFGTCDGS